MKFNHRFVVKSPVDVVGAFHRRAASMAGITPPPIGVRLEAAPETLDDGAEMAFALTLGPLSVPWRARIEEVSPLGFTDRQLRGPFQRWEHRHSFRAVGADQTEVVDEVVAELCRHPVWGLVGLAMWVGMPALFAYRAWRTRALLEVNRHREP